MTVHAPPNMTKEAFLDWVGKIEERYEYAGGRAVMMVRVTLRHALVTTSLLVALATRLSRDRYNVVSEAFAVHVGDSVRFPDLVVQPAQPDGTALKAEAPILIAEVLSPGTLHIDFGKKREEYLGLPSLQAYLILSPDEPKIWIWQHADGGFLSDPDIVEGLDQRIVVAALDLDIPIAEIYRGIC